MNKVLTQWNISAIQKFWRYFTENEHQIRKAIVDEACPGFGDVFSRELKKVGAGIEFVWGISRKKRLTITFSGDGRRKLIPKILGLAQYAPQNRKLKVIAFMRPPATFQKFCKMAGYTYIFKGREVRLKDTFFKVTDYNSKRKVLYVDLVFRNSAFESEEELEAAGKIIFNILLGEFHARRNIYIRDIRCDAEYSPMWRPLTEIRECVDAMYVRKPRIFYPEAPARQDH